MGIRLVVITPTMAARIEEIQKLQITLTAARQETLMKISENPPHARTPALQNTVNNMHAAFNTILRDHCRLLDTSIETLHLAIGLIGESHEGISPSVLATIEKMETIAGPIKAEFQIMNDRITTLEEKLITLLQSESSLRL